MQKTTDSKMFPIIFLWLAIAVVSSEASTLAVNDGLYTRLTVQVSEAVPRQMCHRALNNLQVRLSWSSGYGWRLTF